MPIERILYLVFVPIVEEVDLALNKAENGFSGEQDLFLDHARMGRLPPGVQFKPKGIRAVVTRYIELKSLLCHALPTSSCGTAKKVVRRHAVDAEIPNRSKGIEQRGLATAVGTKDKLLPREMAFKIDEAPVIV